MTLPHFIWLKGYRRFNMHHSRNCCRFSITIGPLGLRWHR